MKVVTYLGSLIQLCGGRKEHCKQISLVCVGSAHSVWTTLGLSQLMAHYVSPFYTAQAPVVLQGICPKWALGFVHFPGPSSSGNQMIGKCTVPGVQCCLITSPVPATQFPGVLQERCLRCAMCLLGSSSLAATLLADVNHPGSKEDLVSNWEPAHSLVEDAISGA